MRSIVGLAIVFAVPSVACDRILAPIVVTGYSIGMNAALHERRYPVDAPFGLHTASYVRVPTSPGNGATARPRAIYDEAEAESALRRVDLEKCARPRARAQRAFVRATFNRTGTVSQVIVDAPFALADDDVKCIADAFGAAAIPAYEGDVHTARISFVLP